VGKQRIRPVKNPGEGWRVPRKVNGERGGNGRGRRKVPRKKGRTWPPEDRKIRKVIAGPEGERERGRGDEGGSREWGGRSSKTEKNRRVGADPGKYPVRGANKARA